MAFRQLHRNRRGDTIVEVLIAMAVVSSVLGITYATMNRNLLISRGAQERTEASKIAQGQLEALKSITDTAASAHTKFCFSPAGAPVTAGFASSVPATDPANDDLSPSGYPAGCIHNTFYHVVIIKLAPKNYKIYVRWDRADGDSKDQVIMVYRTIY